MLWRKCTCVGPHACDLQVGRPVKGDNCTGKPPHKHKLACGKGLQVCHGEPSTNVIMSFGHGSSGECMLLEHERNFGLGMDALVSVCSWNTNGIMVWAWMLW